LNQQAIKVPKQKYFDRLYQWDNDNAFVAGAALGIAFAALFPRSPGSSMWKRYSAATGLGATAGSFTHSVAVQLWPWRNSQTAQKPQEQAKEMEG